ncbi:MAG: Rieske (2Fe-2S) protein [Deltaproteobacteria bacterium]|nr:Rieske (2Fe-2S) protein [Deltaproteobacteria bacterium]
MTRLVTISRRHFCTGLAGCLAVAACGSSDEPTIDAPARSGGVCPTTGALDVGPPSTFTLNTPVYFASGFVFVVRDANGLYALTARCPHQGFTTRVQGNDFICPRHGSLFSFDGAVLTGPATAPLVHYAMCTLASGNLGVLTSQIVPDTDRLNA